MRSIYECGGTNAVPSLCMMVYIFILLICIELEIFRPIKKSNLPTFHNRFWADLGVRWSGWLGGWGTTSHPRQKGTMDIRIHVKSSNWTVAAFRCLSANPKVIESKPQLDTPIGLANEGIREQSIWDPQRTLILYYELLLIDSLFLHGHWNKCSPPSSKYIQFSVSNNGIFKSEPDQTLHLLHRAADQILTLQFQMILVILWSFECICSFDLQGSIPCHSPNRSLASMRAWSKVLRANLSCQWMFRVRWRVFEKIGHPIVVAVNTILPIFVRFFNICGETATFGSRRSGEEPFQIVLGDETIRNPRGVLMSFDIFFHFFREKTESGKWPLANRAEAVKFPVLTHEKKGIHREFHLLTEIHRVSDYENGIHCEYPTHAEPMLYPWKTRADPCKSLGFFMG